MGSRGAWPYSYQRGLDYQSDPHGRGAYGIYAFKGELLDNGFGYGHIIPTLPLWGEGAVKATKEAQSHFGIGVDGVLGPHTARCLLRKRITQAEHDLVIPNNLLQKIASLESGYDPIAQGVADPDDEGLFQENLPSNPGLSQTQCWTLDYIIPMAAKQLKSRITDCHTAQAGAAAWNVGNYYANGWRVAGYPGSGGPVVDGQDIWSRASQYWTLLGKQPL